MRTFIKTLIMSWVIIMDWFIKTNHFLLQITLRSHQRFLVGSLFPYLFPKGFSSSHTGSAGLRNQTRLTKDGPVIDRDGHQPPNELVGPLGASFSWSHQALCCCRGNWVWCNALWWLQLHLGRTSGNLRLPHSSGIEKAKDFTVVYSLVWSSFAQNHADLFNDT